MGPNTESPNKYTESPNIYEDMSIGVSSFLPILIMCGKKRLYGKNRSSLLSYFRENWKPTICTLSPKSMPNGGHTQCLIYIFLLLFYCTRGIRRDKSVLGNRKRGKLRFCEPSFPVYFPHIDDFRGHVDCSQVQSIIAGLYVAGVCGKQSGTCHFQSGSNQSPVRSNTIPDFRDI